MADRERVISTLNAAIDIAFGTNCELAKIPVDIAVHAVDMLKEREPVNHIEANETLPVCVYEDRINKCACGNEINRYWHPYFCGFCGRELIWR